MSIEKTTIIIRTKNSSDIIDQTLKALFSQTFKNFNVIVIDSGSTDDTLKKISKYPHKLININPKSYHPGKVLNKILMICPTPTAVFLNSDCIMLHPNTLQLLLKEMDDKTDAVYARQVARTEALSWVRRDYEASFPKKSQPAWMHFSLPLAIIRIKVWKEVPFYTQSWASEDTKWAVDIKKRGYKIKYAYNALVMHSHNYNYKQLFNRKYVEGEADAYIFGTPLNLYNLIKNYCGSLYHDLIFHLKKHELAGFFKSIPLRFIYHYAHYKGHRYGMKRKSSNDKKLTFGSYQ